VKNWKQTDDAVVWPLRLNEKATFEMTVVYDAPTDSKNNRVAEGDAGKEMVGAHKGASGSYSVQVGSQTFTHDVRTGINVSESLGTMTLEPGTFTIRVSAKKITGEELMRLRAIILKPVQ
jgi:hypothetical protein